MSDTTTSEAPSLAGQANDIAHVIGIMSGKGGVGKSLVTGLLAVALRKRGFSVGILDADITGPSIPKMFGVNTRPEVCELGVLPPETATGIKLMSMNLLLENQGDAVIWRGPLLSNTVKQFWQEVFWGMLDYLVVDLPPGTADIPLTVMQSLPLECAILVTSPQDLAALVVRKAVDMCGKLNVPILGLVQNMAYLKCPACGKMLYPFGRADGERLAHEMGVSHILDLPIDPEISERSDVGTIEGYEANPFIEKIDAITNAIEAISFARKAQGCDAGDCAR